MPRTFVATIGGSTYDIREDRILKEFTGRGTPVVFHPSSAGTDLLDVPRGNRSIRVYARTLSDGSKEIWIDRYRVVVSLQDERHRTLSAFVRSAQSVSSGCSVKAPMPGLIREVAVRAGDAVKKGQRLITLEAMKMENEISAPIDGVVGKCALTPGVNVDKDQELIHITPSEER
ncbi:MAG TPA: biotin/lipoyl-containing protein [Bacteroidota bacterium]|nr:biotin/lipoyl-containing protein [Bacteroidota bacterium]